MRIAGISQPRSILNIALQFDKETTMNSDQLQGKWKQLKGSVKEKWGKLTDDDLDMIAGQHDQLVGKIQERYGISKEEAAKQLRDWNASVTRDVDTTPRRRAS